MKQAISLFPLQFSRRFAWASWLVLLHFSQANAQQSPFTDIIHGDVQLQESIQRYTASIEAKAAAPEVPVSISYPIFLGELLDDPDSDIASSDLIILQGITDAASHELAEKHHDALIQLCANIAISEGSASDIAELGARFDDVQRQSEQGFAALVSDALGKLSPAGARIVESRWYDFSERTTIVFKRLDMAAFARARPEAARTVILEGCASIAPETNPETTAPGAGNSPSDAVTSQRLSSLSLGSSCETSSSTECVNPNENRASDDAALISRSAANLESPLPAPVIITGIIHTAADGVLVLQTESARYVKMVLPAEVTVERHTPANLDDLRVGDIVGAVVGGDIGGVREAVSLRVYRNLDGTAAATLRPFDDASAPRGLELRGVVRNIASRPDGRALRLGTAERESTLQISRGIPVTIIDAAAVSALRPFSVRVRAETLRQADGSLLVTKIDIL